MKSNLLTATLITAILVAPATSLGATDADIAELRRALQQVNQRLDALEQQNQSLKTQNDQLAAKNQELETKGKAIEETNDRQTDALAQASARAKSAEWASRIAWKGDFRYRHENVDPEEAVNDQTRQRIRARFGLTAKINDTINATLQLATSGGNNDPRSTNQSLGSGCDRKGVAIDLAYLDWAPANGLNVDARQDALPVSARRHLLLGSGPHARGWSREVHTWCLLRQCVRLLAVGELHHVGLEHGRCSDRHEG